MDSKLTLKLDQEVIEKAKRFAQGQQTNLSQLIENYLLNLTRDVDSPITISPLVKSLSGIIELPASADVRKESREHLRRKYAWKQNSAVPGMVVIADFSAETLAFRMI